MDGLILPRVFHAVFVKSIFSQHRRDIVPHAFISADEEQLEPSANPDSLIIGHWA